MGQALSKALNVRAHEWARLLLLYFTLFVYMLGWTWGAGVTEAALLEQLGVEVLPWFFMVKGTVSIGAIALYSAFADRVSNTHLLLTILAVGTVSVLVGLLLLSLGIAIAYPFLYLILFVLDEIYFAHWYIYVNSFFDTRSAKRIVPILVTAFILASIVAGLTLSLLVQVLPPPLIITIWITLMVGTMLLVWLTPRLLKQWQATRTASDTTPLPTVPADTSTTLQRTSYLESLADGYRYVVQSSLLRWMTVSSLLVVLLLVFLEYQTSLILIDRLGTTERIGTFIGYVIAVSNIIMFPIQLFAINRIIGRVGVGNANLIYPVANLAVCGSIITTQSIPVAAVAYFQRATFFGTIGYPINGLLYNAVPLRVKGRARAFTTGLVMPIGAVLGGMVLLLVTLVPVLFWLLPLLTALAAMFYLGSALAIRKKYAQALIAMLEEQDYSSIMLQSASTWSAADPATLSILQKKLSESSSDEFTVFMAKLISQVGGKEAAAILEETARDAGSPLVRSALLDMLRGSLSGDATHKVFRDFLDDPDAQVRLSALAGLEEMADLRDTRLLLSIQTMLTDADAFVRREALAVLLRTANPASQHQALQTLDAMLTSEDATQRAGGVYALGKSGQHQFVERLLDYVTDPSDEVRLEAATALEHLTQAGLPPALAEQVVQRMSVLVSDSVERVRLAALVVPGAIGSEKALDILIRALTDSSIQIRSTAADTLVQIGKAGKASKVGTGSRASAPPGTLLTRLTPKLESGTPLMRKMAAVVLSRIRPETFASSIAACVQENLQSIYRAYGRLEALSAYEGYQSVELLRNFLREHNRELLDEIFYLLAAIHDAEALRVVTEALRSASSQTRANATEALEAMTTPQIARLIEPLFDPDMDMQRLLHLSKEVWHIEHPGTMNVLWQLASDPDSAWVRAMTVFALGEIGAALGVKEDPASKHETRTARVADMLSSLAGSAGEGGSERPPLRRRESSNPAAPDTLSSKLTLAQIKVLLQRSHTDTAAEVHLARRSAYRIMAGQSFTESIEEGGTVLSTIERIITLKGVPFFQGMTVEQLKILATVCEEQFFPKDTPILHQGDPGGTLYVMVSGRVGIEQEKRKGYSVRLASLEAPSSFGEETLFDETSHSSSAIAIQDTLTLRLKRAPLIALARQNPGLSLELINVLSQRLRDANARIAELTRSRPRELHKLFDQFDA